MVVHGDRKRLLGAMLSDHVLVEDFEDLTGLGQVAAGGMSLLLQLFPDDVVAQLHAFIADEHAGPRDQLAHLVLALSAEGAVEDLGAVAGAALAVFGHAFAALMEWDGIENITGRNAPSPGPDWPERSVKTACAARIRRPARFRRGDDRARRPRCRRLWRLRNP